MPMRGELSIPAGRVGSATAAPARWDRVHEILTDPELLKVAGICALGLAITLFLIYIPPPRGK
jgi:hypothetical protein